MENVKQKVRMISKTTDGLEVFYTACKACTSPEDPSDIFDSLGYPLGVSREEMLRLVMQVIESGHHSVLEHVYVVFAISGFSRVCTHQLVRHRHMSFSQKSQRYVTEKEQFKFLIPKTIQDNEDKDLIYLYQQFMENSHKFYSLLIGKGIPSEDARFVLPNACETSLVESLNIRELIHLCNERLCSKAQLEIRELVGLMRDETLKRYPFLKDYLVPKCKTAGYCLEKKSCGIMKKRKKAEKEVAE